MVLIQFGTMVVDRALYLRKTVLGKVIFQVILVFGIHFWMFFILPGVTDRYKDFICLSVLFVCECVWSKSWQYSGLTLASAQRSHIVVLGSYEVLGLNLAQQRKHLAIHCAISPLWGMVFDSIGSTLVQMSFKRLEWYFLAQQSCQVEAEVSQSHPTGRTG